MRIKSTIAFLAAAVVVLPGLAVAQPGAAVSISGSAETDFQGASPYNRGRADVTLRNGGRVVLAEIDSSEATTTPVSNSAEFEPGSYQLALELSLNTETTDDEGDPSVDASGDVSVSFSVAPMGGAAVARVRGFYALGTRVDARLSFDNQPTDRDDTDDDFDALALTVNPSVHANIPDLATGNANLALSLAADESTGFLTGTVTLSASVSVNEADTQNFSFTKGSAEAIIEILIDVVEPEESGTYFWEGLNGSFDDETNWEPEGVPGAGDTAVFDKDQLYVVTMGTVESSRALVDRGQVTFDGGSYSVLGGGPGDPSLIVGNDAADAATLALVSGHTLQSPFATVGRGSSARGFVVVLSEGASTAWNVDGRLVIGELGEGDVSIFDNGRLNAGEVLLGNQAGSSGKLGARSNGTFAVPSTVATSMAVGINGAGEVTVVDDAVSTGTVVFGVEAGAEGLGTVSAQEADGAASWSTQQAIIGDKGFGDLWVQSKGLFSISGAEPSILGNAAGSEGVVTVEGCDAEMLVEAPSFFVGRSGWGFADVLDGGLLDIDAGFSIGVEEDSQGTVTVSGSCSENSPSVITVAPEAGLGTIVGVSGAGVLSILDGAEGYMDVVTIGAFAGGEGLAVVDDADWFVESDLIVGLLEDATGTLILANNALVSCGGLSVGPGSGIFGNGTLEVPAGPGNSVEGTIGAGIWVQTPPPVKQSGPVQRLRGHGTLVINGDLEMTGGVLALSIGGLGANVQDKLIVNGDLNLDGTTIRLLFTGAYGPQPGDAAPLIQVSGELNATDLVLEYAGLEDGFDFAMNQEEGELAFEALTDGVADSPRAEDLNLDGVVNAVDVQLVINGALGLIGIPETDVNFDKVTNAVDVQLVINAALGL